MIDPLPQTQRIKAHGWRELEQAVSDTAIAQAVALCGHGAPMPIRAYTKGPCRVLVGHEDHNGKMRYHLSVSCQARYPGWEEIKDARYSLLPLGLHFAMILPPPNEYVNLHPNCFHLWEIDHAEW